MNNLFGYLAFENALCSVLGHNLSLYDAISRWIGGCIDGECEEECEEECDEDSSVL
jgi:hypothetical protein